VKVLVGCEASGIVSAAFRALGHESWSCDLLKTAGDPRWHIQGDALEAAHRLQPDLAVFHPPCTHVSGSGARWAVDHFVKKKTGPETFKGERGYWHDGSEKRRLQAEAVAFVLAIDALPIELLAIENPVGRLSTLWRPPDQYIQPWQFGHGETKKTGLWLRGLEPLAPTDVVSGREARIHRMPPSEDRGHLRSIFYPGIAAAMAAQWGKVHRIDCDIGEDCSCE